MDALDFLYDSSLESSYDSVLDCSFDSDSRESGVDVSTTLDSPPGSPPPEPELLVPPAQGASTSTSNQPCAEEAGYHSVGSRVQALALFKYGVFIPLVIELTRISRASIYRLKKKVISHGYDRAISIIIYTHYVDDAPKFGRPPTSQSVIDLILLTVTKNSTTRMWSSARIASEVSKTTPVPVLASTVYRTLKKAGFSLQKPTLKPGLTNEAKKARYNWCKDHEKWGMEDWKRVIWTDETAVQEDSARGKRRLWRKKEEAFYPHVIKRRWPGKMTFIWWSCFTWDYKGPYHIWQKETPADRKEIKKDLDERNRLKEPQAKIEWELSNGVRRMGL